MKTILNILLVLFVIGIVAAILIPTTPGGVPKAVAVTRANFSEIRIACHIFRNEYGSAPSFATPAQFSSLLAGENERKLKFFSPGHPLTNDDGTFIDGWRRPLIIERVGEDIRLTSLGKDGISSPDDISELIYERK